METPNKKQENDMQTTIEKKLKLPWGGNCAGAYTLFGNGFSAVVAPVLQSSADSIGVSWRTEVTVSGSEGMRLSATYVGCLTDRGMRMVETFLFDSALGIPHAQKELRRLAKGKKGSAVKTNKKQNRKRQP